MPKLSFGYLFIFFFIIHHLYIEAQSETNNWFFGIYAGINFSSGEPEVLSSGQIDSWEGVTAISSSTGDLLFYTDGINVFDRNHDLMPSGTGLLGDPSSTQSALIIPLPENPDIYFILTMDDIDHAGGLNGLKYSKVDMSLNNGFGDIVANEKNVTLELKMSEKLTAAKHANGIDVWIISQKWGTNKFYSFKLTSDGIEEDAIISSSGFIIGGEGADIDMAKGYMKVSPDGTKLAKANAGLKSIEIFNFNDSTGMVSNGIIDIYLDCEPYGIEFSPNSNFLYVNSWKNNPSRILYQYDLQADNIIESRVIIASGLNGALQLSPDLRIYIAQAQTPYLGRINKPNSLGSDCDVELYAVDLEDGTCHWGLPNFMPFEPDTTVNIKPIEVPKISVLSIFPNPVNDKFTVSIVKGKSSEILIYNDIGILVERVLIKRRSQKIIDVTNWVSGLYIAVVMENGKQIGCKKLIVQNN